MNRTAEYREKYLHAVYRMWDLFVYGREQEKKLERALELANKQIKDLEDQVDQLRGLSTKAMEKENGERP